MQINDYQNKALETAQFPDVGGLNYIYPAFGLAGEVGEIHEKIKKIIRDKNSIMSEEDKILLKKECGDVLWYLAVFSNKLGFTLEDVAQTNIDKLSSRKERNVLGGSGDNR